MLAKTGNFLLGMVYVKWTSPVLIKDTRYKMGSKLRKHLEQPSSSVSARILQSLKVPTGNLCTKVSRGRGCGGKYQSSFDRYVKRSFGQPMESSIKTGESNFPSLKQRIFLLPNCQKSRSACFSWLRLC